MLCRYSEHNTSVMFAPIHACIERALSLIVEHENASLSVFRIQFRQHILSHHQLGLYFVVCWKHIACLIVFISFNFFLSFSVLCIKCYFFSILSILATSLDNWYSKWFHFWTTKMNERFRIWLREHWCDFSVTIRHRSDYCSFFVCFCRVWSWYFIYSFNKQRTYSSWAMQIQMIITIFYSLFV